MLMWVQIRPRIRGRYSGWVLKCKVKITSSVLRTVLKAAVLIQLLSTFSEGQMSKRVQIFKEVMKLLEVNLQALWFADTFLDKCVWCIIRIGLFRKEKKKLTVFIVEMPANQFQEQTWQSLDLAKPCSIFPHLLCLQGCCSLPVRTAASGVSLQIQIKPALEILKSPDNGITLSARLPLFDLCQQRVFR